MTSPSGNHILPHYDHALNNIQSRVHQISDHILEHLALLEKVIAEEDTDGANRIIADYDTMDEESRQIITLCASVLAQFHPLGRDLRLVISLSRCADKLREGVDELTSLARRAKTSIKQKAHLAPDIILPLLDMAASEFKDAVECLKTQNIEAAREVRIRDKKLDKAHRKALSRLVSPEGEPARPLNVNLLFMIRSIERIGDIAKSIAATVVFLKEATDIRHGRGQ